MSASQPYVLILYYSHGGAVAAMAQQIAAIPKYRALRRQGVMRHSHSACS